MLQEHSLHSLLSPQEAQSYYRLTENSYRFLDDDGTNFMNLGVWPAEDIRSAQANLVRKALSLVSLQKKSPSILELGPGWGGSRAIVEDIWPGCLYEAINSSEKQNQYARQLNSQFRSTYLEGYFENIKSLTTHKFDVAFGVESLLHVQNKQSVLKVISESGASHVVLAEICTGSLTEVLENKLFSPSLKYLWSNQAYVDCFRNLGYTKVKIVDLTANVFPAWSDALNAISIEKFKGHPRILKQFQASYLALAKLSSESIVQYSLILAER